MKNTSVQFGNRPAVKMGQLLLYASLALIICIGVTDGEPYFRSDYKYFDSTQAFYKYHENNIPWKKAKLTCESEGAILYYPEDRAEINVVKTLYRDNIWIWLGASRQENGDIKSVDGRDIYHNWDRDEPNNLSGAEDCIVLMDVNGLMNDYHCHALYSFVCKVTVKAIESGQMEITEPEKYPENNRKPRVGHRNFYQYYATPMTWEDAKIKCESNAATLVFPEDEVEAGTIVDYTNQTYWRDWIWQGASYDTQYTTVDGKTLEDVYVNWGPTEPKRRYGTENCVVLCRDGTHRAHNCRDRFPFICKTSVFITAIKPEKGLMKPNSEGVIQTGIPAQNPYEIIQSLVHNHSVPICAEGDATCKTTCGVVDKQSKSHTYFGTVVGEELRHFPVNKKLDAMYAIMKAIEEKWTETETECKKVVKPLRASPPPISTTESQPLLYPEYQ